MIIGDADTTYDFLHLEEIFQPLSDNSYDMVIGNRYEGGMERGAMPLTHRWGVCLLSFLGRRRYHVDVFDFHCGLRGISAQAVKKLDFRTDGMEFATEMIAEAARRKLRIKQVPVALRKCDYKRKSKLRTVRDGIRHLRYIYTGKNTPATLYLAGKERIESKVFAELLAESVSMLQTAQAGVYATLDIAGEYEEKMDRGEIGEFISLLYIDIHKAYFQFKLRYIFVKFLCE